MDRGAWWATVQGVAQSQTPLKRLSTRSPLNRYLEYVYVMNNNLFNPIILSLNLHLTIWVLS